MRLWTIHPSHLDRQGLIALWREALLARAVLRGETRGYRHHPQLERFRAHASPRSAINAYLAAIHAEARTRGYVFDRSKIGPLRDIDPIPVTTEQVSHEWQHLLQKLCIRSPLLHQECRSITVPVCHPLFEVVPGPVEVWERSAKTPG